MIGQEFLKNKWNTDVRKFSRYFETSYFAKSLGMGSTLESSLIFSQESYLPRSAGVNMSVNVFGETLNIFEIGARGEGFETIIEELFGPEGYFREDTFHKVLQGLRNKRDVDQSDLAGFQQSFNNYREEEPKGNYFVRLFGKDILYDSFRGMHGLIQRLTAIPKMFFGNPTNEVNISKSSIFLDGGITIPTSTGLPLSISVNGTYSAALKSFISLDTSELFKSGQGKISAEVFPTATVEVVGLMHFDAIVAKTGLKSLTKMHTNTFFDGSLVIDRENGVKAYVNANRDKMEVMEASVDFFTYDGETYKELESENKKEEVESCTGDFVEQMFLLQTCGELTYHVSEDAALSKDVDGGDEGDHRQVMFAGPSHLSLTTRKMEAFKWYTFHYKWKTDETKADNPTVNFELMFDTGGYEGHFPLEAISPEVSLHRPRLPTKLKVAYDEMMEFFNFELSIPYKEVNILAAYTWKPQLKSVQAEVSAYGSQLVEFSGNFKTSLSGKYAWAAYVNYMKRELLDWSGSINAQNEKASFDTKLQSIFYPAVKFSGKYFIREFRSFSCLLNLNVESK